MLTINQRDEFDRLGLVRLPAAIPRAAVEAMCERVWSALASEHGVHRDARETWTVPRPRGFKALERSGAFAHVGSRIVCEALDDLLGRDAWQRPRRWGRVLATFRTAGGWDVPHDNWHLDFNAPASAVTLPGVNLFTFLAPVLARGGGTLVVAGSHKLVEDLMVSANSTDAGRSRNVRRRLKRAVPWLRDLWSAGGLGRAQRFMNEGALSHGVDLRVVELTGEPGDVIVMHPWVFHTIAPNCRKEPRLMLVEFIKASPS